MRLRFAILPAVLATALACGAGSALAKSGVSPALTDCLKHERLTRTYTIDQIRAALAELPVNAAEYTPCFNVLSNALTQEIKLVKQSQAAPSSSGGSFLPTPILIAVILIVVVGAGLAYTSRRRGPGDGEGGDGEPGEAAPGDEPPPPDAGEPPHDAGPA